jgi:hypothetical protein
MRLLIALGILVLQVFAEPRVYLEPKQRGSVEVLFKQTLNSETRKLKQQQDKELSELKKSNRQKRDEFDRNEKSARRQFFAEHTHGPDRRAYMKDLIERRKKFYSELKQDEKNKSDEFKQARVDLERHQKQRLQEFMKELKEGYKPSQDLWKP